MRIRTAFKAGFGKRGVLLTVGMVHALICIDPLVAGSAHRGYLPNLGPVPLRYQVPRVVPVKEVVSTPLSQPVNLAEPVSVRKPDTAATTAPVTPPATKTTSAESFKAVLPAQPSQR